MHYLPTAQAPTQTVTKRLANSDLHTLRKEAEDLLNWFERKKGMIPLAYVRPRAEFIGHVLGRQPRGSRPGVVGTYTLFQDDMKRLCPR